MSLRAPSRRAECDHSATAYAVEHSCYPDGSAVTLNPERTDTSGKAAVQRQTVAVTERDGTRTAYADHPDRARAIYEAERERLSDQQT